MIFLVWLFGGEVRDVLIHSIPVNKYGPILRFAMHIKQFFLGLMVKSWVMFVDNFHIQRPYFHLDKSDEGA